MNQDIIAGRWKQLLGQATTGLGRITDSNWTTLRGRVEQFFGELQERHGLRRDQALAAIDELSSNVTAPDADELADLNLDSDYGSSPRPGMDNLAATPVCDPPTGYISMIGAAVCRFRRIVDQRLQQHPVASLMTVASLSFVAARWLTPVRRAK
jgi:uncharacterized protein YjbJ (UPF0337 family)